MKDDYFTIAVDKNEIVANLIVNVLRNDFNVRVAIRGNIKKGFFLIIPSKNEICSDIARELIDLLDHHYNVIIDDQGSSLG